MTPTPTPQQDHGAAGFCTDHGQDDSAIPTRSGWNATGTNLALIPDERVETVARVLRERVNLDTVRYEGCEARLDEVILASHTINERVLRIEGSPEVIAAAVVAAMDDETARLRAENEQLTGQIRGLVGDLDTELHRRSNAEAEDD